LVVGKIEHVISLKQLSPLFCKQVFSFLSQNHILEGRRNGARGREGERERGKEREREREREKGELCIHVGRFCVCGGAMS
jgi:hypothetical protein